MSLLKLHHISFRIVAVAYAITLKDPLTLRWIHSASEVKHRAPRSGNAVSPKRSRATARPGGLGGWTPACPGEGYFGSAM